LVHHIKPQVAVVVEMVVLLNQKVMDNQVDQVVVQQEVVLHTLEELALEIPVVPQIQTLLQMVLVMMVEQTQVEHLQLMEHLVVVVPVLLEPVEHYQLVVGMVEQDFKFHQHSAIHYQE
jgi:hypothetical protein